MSTVPKIDNPVSNDQLRSISVLPVLSKVFEKLVAIQMTNYADHAHLLHDRISAFRKGHSTTTALLRVRDEIMVLTDFAKAFDAISFSATIVKFYKLSFSKPFLKWLLSYLSGRSQFVQIDDRKSSYQSSQYGVPQGSILGPMIFNLYVSDLHEVIPSSMECVQYADDTSLYSHFNVKELDSRAVDMNETLVVSQTGPRTPT